MKPPVPDDPWPPTAPQIPGEPRPDIPNIPIKDPEPDLPPVVPPPEKPTKKLEGRVSISVSTPATPAVKQRWQCARSRRFVWIPTRLLSF